MKNAKVRMENGQPLHTVLAILSVPAIIALAFATSLTMKLWTPSSYTATLPKADALVTVEYYMTLLGGNGQYIRAQRGDLHLKSVVENPDWAHYPRLSIYRTPDGNIGFIGPYGSSGGILDFIAMKTRPANSNEADNWSYLGAFDRELDNIVHKRFFTAEESAECLETLMDVSPTLSRLAARHRRCTSSGRGDR